jgi:hypothetical protein
MIKERTNLSTYAVKWKATKQGAIQDAIVCAPYGSDAHQIAGILRRAKADFDIEVVDFSMETRFAFGSCDIIADDSTTEVELLDAIREATGNPNIEIDSVERVDMEPTGGRTQ